MNTRIDAQLKAEGDAALASAGYSPSQAVRAVWTWAAAHEHDPAAIDDFLGNAIQSAAEQRAREHGRKASLVQSGQDLARGMLAELGLAEHAKLVSARLTDHELRDLMYEEMLYEQHG